MAEEKKEGTQKPKRPQAEKRNTQDIRRRQRNSTYRSRVKTALRKMDETLEKGSASDQQKTLSEVFSLVDKGLKKGILKANQVARTKSRLASKVKAKA